MIGKNAKTIVRDKDGEITDLKDSKEVRLAEINKLNQLIVKIISWKILREDIFKQENLKEWIW